jgi:molybdopterin-guanine dinucleotide biosynthesis protein A
VRVSRRRPVEVLFRQQVALWKAARAKLLCMIPPMAELTAFVLAGGQSSRMGCEKALLEFEGQRLIERMLSIARAVDPDARIVASREKFSSYAAVVEDEFSGCGPLAGIHAALHSSRADLNLILAVDMPFVDPEFLRYLAGQAVASGATVTVPQVEGRWQPLCAVYRRNFAEVAGKSLREGKYKIDPLFPEVEVRSIGEKELREQGFTAHMFRNLNTPEDLNSVRSQPRVAELRTGKN